MSEIELNETWIHGKYKYGEIDTRMGTVLVFGEYTCDGIAFFAQGDDADTYIKEIHQIWITDGEITDEEAFLKWINHYL